MMSEWKEAISGEVMDLISGYAFKSKDFKEVPDEDDLPVIKIKNVANGDVNFEGVVYHQVSEKLEKYTLENGDILIAMTGNHPHAMTQVVGDVSRYKLAERALLNQRVGKLVAKDDNCLDFFYYYFKDEDNRNYLANQSSGSANQANISKGDILGLPMTIPEPEEQRAIASVLSSLDDKIDLLHRQNQTLEQMAETLFRQWFVEEADEGWDEGVLGDWVTNPRESVKPQDISLDAKYVALENISKRSVSLISFSDSGDVQSNKYRFNEGDILFGKLRPYFHKVCFAPFSGICSTDILVIRPKTPVWLPFCLFAFFQDAVIDFATAGSGGTRMPRTNWVDLSSYPFLRPDDSLLEKFNVAVQPFLDKIKFNQTQIRTLTALRDTLLPKLMSGEIRINLNHANVETQNIAPLRQRTPN